MSKPALLFDVNLLGMTLAVLPAPVLCSLFHEGVRISWLELTSAVPLQGASLNSHEHRTNKLDCSMRVQLARSRLPEFCFYAGAICVSKFNRKGSPWEDEPLCLAWGFEAGVQQAPMSCRVSRLRLLGWDWGLQNPCKDQHSREARSPPRCPLLTRCCWLLRCICIRDKLWMLSRSTCRKTKRRSRVTAPPADKALNLLEGGLQSIEASAMESNSKKKRKSPSPS